MSKTLPDGHYRFDDGEAAFIAYVHRGVTGDDPVEWFMSADAPYGLHEITPVVVLTVTDHAALMQRVKDLEEALTVLGGDDWGKTVNYLISLAPEPEPTYDAPDAPEDYDDEDKPHYDTPGGF
jgi:hypothetical protein